MFDVSLKDQPGTSGQHPFVERQRSADFASFVGGAQVTWGPALGVSLQIAEEERQVMCARPGCGRDRDDPIHWAPEPPAS
ncbi:MAG: hypothetical protein ABI452_02765 [Candidatus Limnocylindrales bacterium]